MVHPGRIDEVCWEQVFPWLLLTRAARSALLVSVVVATLLGALATAVGWTAIGRIVGVEHAAWPIATEQLEQRVPVAASAATDILPAADHLRPVVRQNPLARAWAVVAGPWLNVLSAEGMQQRIYLTLCGLWSLAVWGLAGGVIAWVTAVRVSRREKAPVGAAASRAVKVWLSAIGGPVTTLLAAALLSLPIVVAGWFMRYEGFAVVVGLAWGLVLLVGLLLAALLLGLLVGWPLMIITAVVDRSDAFDGISRALAYVFQRPLHLLWYLLVAGLLAWVVQWGVSVAAEATIAAAERIASVGAGAARAAELFDEPQSASGWSSWLVEQWRKGIRAGVRWYPFALFWSLATGVYLLLRFQIDQTELDELAE